MTKKELLVTLPRTKHKVHAIGNDIWNCYEASALLYNGHPFNGVFRLSFDAGSKYIIESASLNKYLHSFSMEKMGKDIDEASINFQNQVCEDLSQIVKIPVECVFHTRKNIFAPPILFYENGKISCWKTIDQYKYNPIVLNTFDNYQKETYYQTDILRNCNVYVYLKGNYRTDFSSFIQYIASFYNENRWIKEELCELIYKDIWDVTSPDELFVACLYTRQDGVDVNCVRANKERLIYRFANNLITLTFLQEKGIR